MTMSAKEIREWLETLREDDLVGVDDGGLCLRVAGNPAIYCEIGGICEEDEDETGSSERAGEGV
jgi:hypothetical protein